MVFHDSYESIIITVTGLMWHSSSCLCSDFQKECKCSTCSVWKQHTSVCSGGCCVVNYSWAIWIHANPLAQLQVPMATTGDPAPSQHQHQISVCVLLFICLKISFIQQWEINICDTMVYYIYYDILWNIQQMHIYMLIK